MDLIRVFIFTGLIFGGLGAFALDCHKLVGQKFLQVVEGRIEIDTSEPNQFLLHDEDNHFYFDASLDDGILTMNIELVDAKKGVRSHLRGAEVFAQMMDYFRGQHVVLIAGNWISGTNFEQFGELKTRGLSNKEAASQTWTGRQAAKYGFTVVHEVEIEDAGSMVQVKFKRP